MRANQIAVHLKWKRYTTTSSAGKSYSKLLVFQLAAPQARWCQYQFHGCHDLSTTQ